MAGIKKKVSSLSVLKDIFSGILPDEIVYVISKYHGRWVHYAVPRPVRVKVKEPRKRTRKRHLISHHYV